MKTILYSRHHCSSDIDGIHFDPPEHVKLGKMVANEVRKILDPN